MLRRHHMFTVVFFTVFCSETKRTNCTNAVKLHSTSLIRNKQMSHSYKHSVWIISYTGDYVMCVTFNVYGSKRMPAHVIRMQMRF